MSLPNKQELMTDDIWEVGGEITYAALIILIVASVYAILVPLIDPSAPFSGVVEYAMSIGTLALGLLVGSLLLAASFLIKKVNSFGS